MYYLSAEYHFDSAHFLAGYEGKCRNIHGHRWQVIIKVKDLILKKDKQTEGMIVDFSKLKEDIKKEADLLDHSLIIEKNSIKAKTKAALEEEGFHIVELEFRPTAEQLSKYFYDKMKEKGYKVELATIYETPNNHASYKEDSNA